MEEIRVGMRFQNRSNGRIGYVARIDEVGKCADIMYEEVAEGQSKGGRASLSGLKGQKSWKYLHDETETTVEQVEEVKEEEVASDGTPYTEVMAEIQQDEQNLAENYVKEKKSKKKAEKQVEKKEKPIKEKKERTSKISADEKLAKVNDIVAIINKINVGTPKVYDKKFMVAVFVGKKRMVEFYPRADKISVWCRDIIAEQFAEYSPVFHTTCGMKYQFYVTTTKEVEKVIKTINKED